MKKSKLLKTLIMNLFEGAMIKYRGKLFIVDKIDSASQSSVITVSLCDLDDGIVKIQTFDPKDSLEIFDYEMKDVEYWHVSEDNENDEIFFDVDSLKPIYVPKDICETKRGFIKNGIVYNLIVMNDKVISIMLPRFVEIEVKSVIQNENNREEEYNNSSFIKVELETGASMNVPSYIERSDVIKIDTRKQCFVQRF